MSKIMRMWEALKGVDYLGLRDDVELEFILALLDSYIMLCVEEFITCEGTLSPSTIVHLHYCMRDLASLLKKSDGATIPCYFEHLLMLSRLVLRRVKVKEARLIMESDREGEMVHCYSSPEEFFSGAPER